MSSYVSPTQAAKTDTGIFMEPEEKETMQATASLIMTTGGYVMRGMVYACGAVLLLLTTWAYICGVWSSGSLWSNGIVGVVLQALCGYSLISVWRLLFGFGSFCSLRAIPKTILYGVVAGMAYVVISTVVLLVGTRISGFVGAFIVVSLLFGSVPFAVALVLLVSIAIRGSDNKDNLTTPNIEPPKP